jgi:hypothetical protein
VLRFFIFFLLFETLIVGNAKSADSLLYLEAQGIIGYSSEEDDIIYNSNHSEDVMQKNSLGIDYIKKISGITGDIGTVALQFRTSYNEKSSDVELQVYNAYLKAKTQFADIWIGHNRIAFGLASYWDTHGDLLQSLPMYGFSYDRDWGVGLIKDTAGGDFQMSLSTGSGMGIRDKGNWLLTSRVSAGVLNYDNYNFGLSLMGGEILDTMGYKLMNENPQNIILGGLDFAYNYNNIEQKGEIDFGEITSNTAFAALYRLGFNFLEENRLKLEGQYVYTKKEKMDDYAIGGGITYRFTSSLSTRLMYERKHAMDDHRIVVQVYFYSGV